MAKKAVIYENFLANECGNQAPYQAMAKAFIKSVEDTIPELL